MAYATKYRALYKDYDNLPWQVDIEPDNYVGEIIPIRTVLDSACVFTFSNNTDDKYEPIISTSVDCAIYNEGQVDINELQSAGDFTIRVSVYKDSVIYWQGFLIPDGIEQRLASAPHEFSISATDGLMLLEGREISIQNMQTPPGVSVRSPLNVIREILYRTQNLGTLLPIRWTAEVENLAFPGEDSLFGSVEWSPSGEGFETFQHQRRDCLWILENILKSFQCRIYLFGGLWNITRINDIADGMYDWKQIDATTGVPTITTGTIDNNKTVQRGGDYIFINNDHLITVNPGVKAVKTTYRIDFGENIIPNGGFEYSSLGIPLYWGVTAGTGSILQDDPLRDNSSKDPSLPDRSLRVDNSLGTGDVEVSLVNTSGIAGLPIDTAMFPRMNLSFLFSIEQDATGMPEHTFGIRVSFTKGSGLTETYYLSEFGQWRLLVSNPINFTVPGYTVGDIANIDFRTKNQTGMINFPIIQAGSVPKELELNDVQELLISLVVFEGAIVLFDDLSITVDDNNDIWEAEITPSQYTKIDERELEISSAFNGFYTTSYRTNWDRNDNEFVFTDGMYTGTLTGMNSHAILRNNYLPSKIFNGSIFGDDWSYGRVLSIQTMEGKKFQQTNASFNTETKIANITAIETRNDAILPTMKHYGTNDDIFSSYGSV